MTSPEYLQKFGYRSYEGEKTAKSRRILSLIWFEVSSTWKKSIFGRVILVIVALANFFGIVASATLNTALEFAPELGPTKSEKIDLLHDFVAGYMVFTFVPVRGGTYQEFFGFTFQLGIFLIILFGITGGGLFADDRQGNVVEIYMSKLQRNDYILGKVGSIVVYTNIFIMIPLLIMSYFTIQAYDLNHLELWSYYLGVIIYSIVLSLIIGLAVLSLSVVMKRNYASLSFFLIYLLGSVFGAIIVELEPANELLLLISPEYFFSLLAYVCLGDINLAKYDSNFVLQPFLLNDGVGLEYWHIIGLAILYLLVLGSFLYYKVKKITTEVM